MLIDFRTRRRTIPFCLGIAIVLTFLILLYASENQRRLARSPFANWRSKYDGLRGGIEQILGVSSGTQLEPPPVISSSNGQTGEHPNYLEIFSASTPDKQYFNMKFGEHDATNANIIPSFTDETAWTIVAVKQRSKVPNSLWFAELACDARFDNGVLKCIEEPTTLPIPSTNSDKCTGDSFGWWGLNIGPHDGRVFYGPEHPYIMYGSNSQYNCFGLWMQDFRMLMDWGIPVWPDEYFRLPTDLQRPGPHNVVEKNWFAFWDKDKNMYIHHDTLPRRVFAQVQKDGTVGPDLGLVTEAHDTKCLKAYLPSVPEGSQDDSFHQATNSLAITLCKRQDPDCEETDENTFLMTIIQHKTLPDGHAEYDPYVYIFERSPPFKMRGVGPKPLWINGREQVNWEGQSQQHSQMFYVTSMSWKDHSQKYHGYMDDIMFIAFGIEDDRPAAIDIVAGDLLQGLVACTED